MSAVAIRYRNSMGVADRTAVLLLPGMHGTGELLAPLADQLSMRRPVQIIAYPNDRALGYNDLIKFVIARVPKDKFVVLGESFSGPIAIEVAASEKRVAGLVLASSFARSPVPALLTPIASMFDATLLPTRLAAATLVGSRGSPELKDRLVRC